MENIEVENSNIFSYNKQEKKMADKWDQPQMKTYEVQMPGSTISRDINADQEVHEKDHGFLLLYVEGTLVARIPKEALIVITGKLHK